MDDVELFALGRMTNSSDAMFARRRRILDETRAMLVRDGLEGFNVRELCRRADVGSRTFYNAFTSKENVIALAIKGYFDAFQSRAEQGLDLSTFEGSLTHQATVILRNQQLPSYLQAVAAIYFSMTADQAIRRVLTTIGEQSWLRWLRAMQIRRQLERGVDIDGLALDLSDLQFAKVHEWGVGSLSDEAYFDRSIAGVLTMLSGATRGEARADVREAVLDFHDKGPLRARIVSEAQTRIALMQADEGKT